MPRISNPAFRDATVRPFVKKAVSKVKNYGKNVGGAIKRKVLKEFKK